MGNKETAESFLKLASSGKVDEAFQKYIHPKFLHHNAYFKGDRESLQKAMNESTKQFPLKSYEALHVLEDGDLVAIHGRVILSQEMEFSLVHVFRFDGGLIIEEWEASQQALKDSPNSNGLF